MDWVSEQFILGRWDISNLNLLNYYLNNTQSNGVLVDNRVFNNPYVIVASPNGGILDPTTGNLIYNTNYNFSYGPIRTNLLNGLNYITFSGPGNSSLFFYDASDYTKLQYLEAVTVPGNVKITDFMLSSNFLTASTSNGALYVYTMSSSIAGFQFDDNTDSYFNFYSTQLMVDPSVELTLVCIANTKTLLTKGNLNIIDSSGYSFSFVTMTYTISTKSCSGILVYKCIPTCSLVNSFTQSELTSNYIYVSIGSCTGSNLNILFNVTSSDGGLLSVTLSLLPRLSFQQMTSFDITPWYRGTRTIFSSGFNSSYGCAIDTTGNIFVADKSVIAKVSTSGVYSIYRNSTSAFGVAVDSLGNVYVAGSSIKLRKLFPNGTTVSLGSGLSYPTQLILDSASNIYVADNTTIKMIDTNNVTSVFWSNVNNLNSNTIPLAYDNRNNILYFFEVGTMILRSIYSDASIFVQVYSGFANTLRWMAPDGFGNLYLVFPANTTSGVQKLNINTGTIASVGSGYSWPNGICLDSSGNIFATDYSSGKLSIVQPGILEFIHSTTCLSESL